MRIKAFYADSLSFYAATDVTADWIYNSMTSSKHSTPDLTSKVINSTLAVVYSLTYFRSNKVGEKYNNN